MSKLTIIERLGLSVLRKRGYTNIIKTSGSGLPDFICDQGRFEIKSDGLQFTLQQTLNFRDDDTILVFKNRELVYEFKWKNRKPLNKKRFSLSDSRKIKRIDKEIFVISKYTNQKVHLHWVKSSHNSQSMENK